ncbi:MAG: hypothetical protein AAGJ18_17345, partial [Bacteroidota bacterium]
KLTAKQVKQVLQESVVPLDKTVIKPGADGAKVPFKTLSVTGGVVNAYKAVEKAQKVKGKKKIRKGSGKSSNGGSKVMPAKKEKVA